MLQEETPVTERRQTECGHLVIIANQHDVADQHWMIPSLALEHPEPRELSELVGRRLYQYQLSLLRQHQQHILIGQKHKLTVTVPWALPILLPVTV
jgi:hypothetical protein